MSKIFIFIPLYNGEPFISIAIQGVLSQSFTEWELLIIDDCSTDKSFDIAKQYEQKDSRIKVIKNESNLGMLGNWNKGISLCRLPFFVKLDADDIWHQTFLEKSIKVLDTNPEVGLVFTKFVNIDEKGNLMPETEVPFPIFARNKSFSTIKLVEEGENKMLSYPILRQGLSIIRKEVFDNIGMYRFLLNSQTQASTDTEFYFRVGCHYKIHCIDETLYYYRIHKNSISRIDADVGLSAQKIYEVKHCIFDYYFEQGKISKQFFQNQIKRIKLNYNLEIAYQYRYQRKYAQSIIIMLKIFYLSPIKTTTFYFDRLWKKMLLKSGFVWLMIGNY